MKTTGRPLFPHADTSIPEVWKTFLKSMYDDLYPKIQPFSPLVAGMTGGTVSGGYSRQGRHWIISVVVQGSSSTSSAYFEIPFNASTVSVFTVKIGNDLKPAKVNLGENKVYLPNWTSSEPVYINGILGE
jgi:hypothetical protein